VLEWTTAKRWMRFSVGCGQDANGKRWMPRGHYPMREGTAKRYRFACGAPWLPAQEDEGLVLPTSGPIRWQDGYRGVRTKIGNHVDLKR